jgi:hypothetical protein
MDKKDKTVIFIFGMGKSGTSLVSQLVQDITDYQDRDLIQGRMDNVLGYFENRHMVRINSEILNKLQVDWPLKERVRGGFKMNFPEQEKSAQELFNNLFKKNNTLVLKDPRLTITLPFWLKQSESYTTKFIFVFRHPMEVALSLAKAAGFDTPSSLLSWELNNGFSLEIIKNQKTLILSYDKLMNQPRAEIQRIYTYLDLKPDPKELASQVFSALPEIRHYNFDTKNFENLTPSVVRMYKRVLELYEKNKLEFSSDLSTKPLELSDAAKIIILRNRIKKLDMLIRDQFDEMQKLGKEYQNQLASNLHLADENRRLYSQLLETR